MDKSKQYNNQALNIIEKNGHLNSAILLFEQAINIATPSYKGVVLLNLSEVYYKKVDYEMVNITIDRYLNIYPLEPIGLFKKGCIFICLNREKEAINWLKKAQSECYNKYIFNNKNIDFHTVTLYSTICAVLKQKDVGLKVLKQHKEKFHHYNIELYISAYMKEDITFSNLCK